MSPESAELSRRPYEQRISCEVTGTSHCLRAAEIQIHPEAEKKRMNPFSGITHVSKTSITGSLRKAGSEFSSRNVIRALGVTHSII